MKLSVVIPAHNEEGCIEKTVRDLYAKLASARIDHEIIVVNDNSIDRTAALVETLRKQIPTLRLVHNKPPNGFGLAVRRGLETFKGDAVAIFMADNSDSSDDLVKFFRVMEEQSVDCVFGSRFIKGGKTVDYPPLKRILNRIANKFIQALFRLHYNDTTNAFKLFRRHAIEGLKPFLSNHFNLTVELPLKAMIRGYSYAVVPNQWTNREVGQSNLRIKEMGSRYLFIVLYCFIEKWLTRGDYRRHDTPDSEHLARTVSRYE
jgi:dolichol-phosphate mannosyltransferase